MSVFGWDVSTSVVGLTILNDDGSWVKTEHFEFEKTKDGPKSIHDKMDECEWWIEDMVGPFFSGSHHHFFEDRLSNFRAGRTMIQTLMKLGAFNALFSYVTWKKHLSLLSSTEGTGVGMTHIHPTTVKSIMKKEGLIIPKGSDKKALTLEFVSRKIPGFLIERTRTGTPKPFMFDRADSYITARAGWLRSRMMQPKKLEVF